MDFATKIKAAHKMDLDRVLASCRAINKRANAALNKGLPNTYDRHVQSLEAMAAPLITAYGEDKAIALITAA